MEYFKGKCPLCGKVVFLPAPDEKRFCSKVCEANYKFERDRILHLA